ncbi:TIGR02594 family protein [Rhodobacter sp. NTK016B]|uniref:C40 family peptidase n=1 Tax=Rhodobacter sp. NTK016B TaxID=2759676 RepID=UPI001A8F6F98|nr:TIGR02594 family protein [Rhodobacter sp. NTK016B]MBN8294539.1 TIGR02594 family protein [Rhodobacter sp. NTK016B]
MTNFNPAILEAAGRHLGVEEWPGAQHNPTVQAYFEASGGRATEPDETPWCAAFVGAVLAELGIENTGRLNARSYLQWGAGVSMREALPGDVVVFWRVSPDSWQGHVAFLVRFEGDHVIVRGGNQGNKVSDRAYPVSRVLGFRRAVEADASRRPVLQLGSRGPAVREAQERLRDLGFFPGHIDGIFGPRMRGAVLAFQGENFIDTDGIVGGVTWDYLGFASARPARAVSASDLRETGSRTVQAADQGQALTGVTTAAGAIGVVAERTDEASQALDGAVGVMEKAQGVLVAYWPVLLVGACALLAWHFFGKIRDARVEDARTGKHMGR